MLMDSLVGSKLLEIINNNKVNILASALVQMTSSEPLSCGNKAGC